MGLTDEHLIVMCLARDNDGIIPVKVGDPLLEGMVSMGLLARAGIVNSGRGQYYIMTDAGDEAYIEAQNEG